MLEVRPELAQHIHAHIGCDAQSETAGAGAYGSDAAGQPHASDKEAPAALPILEKAKPRRPVSWRATKVERRAYFERFQSPFRAAGR